MPDEPLKYSEADWFGLRNRFLTSPMAGMDLRSLAENAGTTWTGIGVNLTPEDFLDLDWPELQAHPALATTQRVNRFLDVLKETLAFDDPFSALVTDTERKPDAGIEQRAAKLGLPLDFPVSLMHLTVASRSICNSEQLRTLGEFLEFSGRMARNIVIGDDFRSLLNAVNAGDEATIARYLPYRPGSSGLHLQEGVAMLAGRIEARQFLRLVKLYGGALNVREEELAAQVTPTELPLIQEANQQYLERVVPWFEKQKAALDNASRSLRTLQDYLSVLKDDKKERLACAELWRFYHGAYPVEKRSFLARLFGFGK